MLTKCVCTQNRAIKYKKQKLKDMKKVNKPSIRVGEFNTSLNYV